MKLSSMAIVTSFELNCVRQPIPFNIQTLTGTCADAAKRKNFKSHLKTCPLFMNPVSDRLFFCLLQERMASEGEGDKPTQDIKR